MVVVVVVVDGRVARVELGRAGVFGGGGGGGWRDATNQPTLMRADGELAVDCSLRI